MALMSKKQKRPEKQELWSDCVFFGENVSTMLSYM
jgi:hypothetical protein